MHLPLEPRVDAAVGVSEDDMELDRELRRLSVLQRREMLARRRTRAAGRTGATRVVVLRRRVGAGVAQGAATPHA